MTTPRATKARRCGRLVCAALASATAACAGEAGGPGPDPSEIPDVAACAPVRDWDPAAVAFEGDVLERMASLRRQRPLCPGAAWPGPGDVLVEDGALTCAARIHALDMATEGFVGHEGSDGSTPEERVARTGAVVFAVHEAIVAGAPTPAAAVDLLADDPEDCAAMVGPAYDRVGAGYAPDPSGASPGYLVVVFAATESPGTTGGTASSSSG